MAVKTTLDLKFQWDREPLLVGTVLSCGAVVPHGRAEADADDFQWRNPARWLAILLLRTRAATLGKGTPRVIDGAGASSLKDYLDELHDGKGIKAIFGSDRAGTPLIPDFLVHRAGTQPVVLINEKRLRGENIAVSLNDKDIGDDFEALRLLEAAIAAMLAKDADALDAANVDRRAHETNRRLPSVATPAPSRRIDEPAKPGPFLGTSWLRVPHLGSVQTASNGLEYRIFKLPIRECRNEFDRGKQYLVGRISSATMREELQEKLLRHRDVCEKVGPHPNIAANRTVFSEGHDYWVIDRWVHGSPLSERLAQGSLSHDELRLVARGIAEALRALHAAGVWRRELAPRNIIVSPEGNPVLTDFELAKLTTGQHTVRGEAWPEDPYRAPEVETGSDHENVRADLYSWGKIMREAVVGAGRKEATPEERRTAESLHLPRSVATIVERCVRAVPVERPRNIGDVIKALDKAKW